MTEQWITVKSLRNALNYSEKVIRQALKDNEENIEVKKVKNTNYYNINSLKDLQPFSDYFETIKGYVEELPLPKGGDGTGSSTEGGTGESTTGSGKGLEVLETEDGEEEDTEEEDEEGEVPTAIRVGRKIALDPDVLLYYSLMKEAGGNVTLSQFINDCVRRYMIDLGYEVIISTPEVD